VVTVKAVETGLIVIESAWVAIAITLSITWTVKLATSAVVGVPEIIPVAPSRVRPAGNAPALMDQE